jgi:uncharacterized repeat protein (TIGR01451 family)
VGAPSVALPGAFSWIEINVTDLVRRWMDGSLDNNGLLLKMTARGAVGYELFSADHSTSAYRPYLEVSYAIMPTPTPETPTPVPPVPALELDKLGPAGPLPDEETTLTYTITARNVGTALAAGIAITDVLPLGTIFQSCTQDGVYSAQNHIITWQGISLAEGESLTLEVHLELADWVRQLGNIVNVVHGTCADCPGVAEDYWTTIFVEPTATATATPTITPTPSHTPTPTATPTVTPTPKPFLMYWPQFYFAYHQD